MTSCAVKKLRIMPKTTNTNTHPPTHDTVNNCFCTLKPVSRWPARDNVNISRDDLLKAPDS